MKKISTYLIVYILSALVLYGGSGINIASFCCDKCQSEGISGIAKGACCEIHHHDNEDNIPEPVMDSDCDSHKAHCFLSRIENDWNSNIPSFKYIPYCFELIEVCLPVGLSVSTQVINDITNEYSTGPPIICPRTYLSLLTILLI